MIGDYTYDQFKEKLGTWLKNGRFLWYITGNYAHDKAIELVEQTRTLFDVKPLAIQDVPEVKPVSIAAGVNHIIESPLVDKNNENSAIRTYFEAGVNSDNKANLGTQVIMNYFNQPFFHDLRTTQQIGYIVLSRACEYRETFGLRLTV